MVGGVLGEAELIRPLARCQYRHHRRVIPVSIKRSGMCEATDSSGGGEVGSIPSVSMSFKINPKNKTKQKMT